MNRVDDGKGGRCLCMWSRCVSIEGECVWWLYLGGCDIGVWISQEWFCGEGDQDNNMIASLVWWHGDGGWCLCS